MGKYIGWLIYWIVIDQNEWKLGKRARIQVKMEKGKKAIKEEREIWNSLVIEGEMFIKRGKERETGIRDARRPGHSGVSRRESFRLAAVVPVGGSLWTGVPGWWLSCRMPSQLHFSASDKSSVGSETRVDLLGRRLFMRNKSGWLFSNLS